MAIPRVDLLVDRIRRLTHEQSFTDSATLSSQRGVQTQTIVEFLNEAQRALHGVIHGLARSIYVKSTTIDIVADQESYTLPSDAFLGGNVLSVQYLYGSGGDYRPLIQKTIHQRDTRTTGVPVSYIHFNNTLLINPIPTSAKTAGIRLVYEYVPRDVDVRRGKVSAVDDGSNPTSITVTDKSLLDVMLTATNAPEDISIVDSDGNQQMVAIPVSSYDSTTGVITLDSFTPSSGEAVAVNDYVVIGANASTHSPFPDFCENFLVSYVVYSILDWRGHPGAPAAAQKLQIATEQVMDAFSDYNTDNLIIPELDSSRSLHSDGYL